jgi:hypothetical protein
MAKVMSQARVNAPRHKYHIDRNKSEVSSIPFRSEGLFIHCTNMLVLGMCWAQGCLDSKLLLENKINSGGWVGGSCPFSF